MKLSKDSESVSAGRFGHFHLATQSISVVNVKCCAWSSEIETVEEIVNINVAVG